MFSIDKTMNQKLSRFEESIMKIVEERCAEIHMEIEEFREKELNKYAFAIKSGGETDISDEIAALKADNKKNLSEKRIEMRKKIFEKRAAYAEEIFKCVEKEIEKFTKSVQYKDFLIDKTARLASYCTNSAAVIKLRKDDMVYAEDILKICGASCSAEIDESIKLGGIMFINEAAAVIIDETLDSILAKEKKKFYENSGFSVLF